jgi:hypothetical protein
MRIICAFRDRDYRYLFGAAAYDIDPRAEIVLSDTIEGIYRIFGRRVRFPCDLVVIGDDVLEDAPDGSVEDIVEFVDPAPVAFYTRSEDRAYLRSFMQAGCQWPLRFSRGEREIKAVLRLAMHARTAA